MSVLSTYQRTADPFKQKDHIGLVFTYGIGVVRDDNVVIKVAGGTLTLENNTTNYIEVSKIGVVSSNINGYSEGSVPLYTAITESGEITSVTDDRCFFSTGGGGGRLFKDSVAWPPLISMQTIVFNSTTITYQ